MIEIQRVVGEGNEALNIMITEWFYAKTMISPKTKTYDILDIFTKSLNKKKIQEKNLSSMS